MKVYVLMVLADECGREDLVGVFAAPESAARETSRAFSCFQEEPREDGETRRWECSIYSILEYDIGEANVRVYVMVKESNRAPGAPLDERDIRAIHFDQGIADEALQYYRSVHCGKSAAPDYEIVECNAIIDYSAPLDG